MNPSSLSWFILTVLDKEACINDRMLEWENAWSALSVLTWNNKNPKPYSCLMQKPLIARIAQRINWQKCRTWDYEVIILNIQCWMMNVEWSASASTDKPETQNHWSAIADLQLAISEDAEHETKKNLKQTKPRNQHFNHSTI